MGARLCDVELQQLRFSRYIIVHVAAQRATTTKHSTQFEFGATEVVPFVPIEHDSMRKFCSRGITSRCGWWFDVLPPPPSLRRAVPFVFGFLFDGRPTNRPTDDVSLRHTVMEIFEFTNWEESWIVWLGLDGCYLYLEKHNWIGAMCSDKCLWRFARVSRKCPS